MQLHTVNKHDATLARCLSVIQDDDAILLIEDGVYAAMDITETRDTWSAVPAGMKCFVLGDDLAARGISDTMLPRFEVVTWQQFVALACEYDKVVSWG